MTFEDFLKKLERTSEGKIREQLEKINLGYVDTPGFYHQEARQYGGDIIRFYHANAGAHVLSFYQKVYKKHGMKFFTM